MVEVENKLGDDLARPDRKVLGDLSCMTSREFLRNTGEQKRAAVQYVILLQANAIGGRLLIVDPSRRLHIVGYIANFLCPRAAVLHEQSNDDGGRRYNPL